MSSPLRVAAVAVISLVIGVNVGPRLDPGTDIGAVSSPTPSPVTLPRSGPLEAGTYVVDDPSIYPGRITLTVPAGWEAIHYAILGKTGRLGDPASFDLAFSPWVVRDVYVDPCRLTAGLVQPSPGPSAADLAAALAGQATEAGSSITDVTIGGRAGKLVELPTPEALDITTCDLQRHYRWPGGGYYYDSGQRNGIYILDVADGERLVLDTMSVPGVSEADLAELRSIVDSVVVEPAVMPSPIASASPVLDARLPPTCDTQPATLDAGRYIIHGPGIRCSDPAVGWPSDTVSVEVPDGWTHTTVGRGGGIRRDDAAVLFGVVGQVADDPCRPDFQAALEPGVDGLVAALGSIQGVTTTGAQDVELDGRVGSSLVITLPPITSACESMTLWSTPPTDNGTYHNSSAAGWIHRVWVVDVDGVVFVVDASHAPGISPEKQAALEAIIHSIDITQGTQP